MRQCIHMLPVWLHQFEKDNELNVCNACCKGIPPGITQPKHLNTTNLIRHLKVSHVSKFSKVASMKAESKGSHLTTQTALAQLSVTETLQQQQPYSKDSKKTTYSTAVCLPQLYRMVYMHIYSIMKSNSFTSDIWNSVVCP